MEIIKINGSRFDKSTKPFLFSSSEFQLKKNAILLGEDETWPRPRFALPAKNLFDIFLLVLRDHFLF